MVKGKGAQDCCAGKKMKLSRGKSDMKLVSMLLAHSNLRQLRGESCSVSASFTNFHSG